MRNPSELCAGSSSGTGTRTGRKRPSPRPCSRPTAALEQAREDLGKIEQEISALKEKIRILKENIDTRTKELETGGAEPVGADQSGGIRKRSRYLASRLDEEERESARRPGKLSHQGEDGTGRRRRTSAKPSPPNAKRTSRISLWQRSRKTCSAGMPS